MKIGRRNVLLAAVLFVVALPLAASRSARLVVACATGKGLSWQSSEPHDFESDFFGYRWTGNTANYIDAQVERYGAYELPVLATMGDALRIAAADGPTVAVDVGANIGHHSLFLTRTADRVIAVEPYPPVLERLRAVLARNGVTTVEIHAVGYADAPGSLPFHVPSEANTGMGSFAGDKHTGTDAIVELPLVRGDDDLSGIDRVALVKIDIEGFEKSALRGMAGVLARSRPFVVMELNVSGEQGFHDEKELRSAFPPGYEFFTIREPPRIEWKLHGSRITCAPGRYDYHLTTYDMTFDRDGYNLLALPGERHATLVHRMP